MTPLYSLDAGGLILVPNVHGERVVRDLFMEGCYEGTLDREACWKCAAKLVGRDIEKSAHVLTLPWG